LDECQEAIQDLGKRIETQVNLQQSDRSDVENKQRSMDKFLTRKSVLIQKKETALRHIRELGVLPDEAFEKYQGFNSKQVMDMPNR
jgi:structural maintenance of chromosome 3 (chondroitin sulfate proteoglycan 6)